jgi:hypothetical protein
LFAPCKEKSFPARLRYLRLRFDLRIMTATAYIVTRLSGFFERNQSVKLRIMTPIRFILTRADLKEAANARLSRLSRRA